MRTEVAIVGVLLLAWGVVLLWILVGARFASREWDEIEQEYSARRPSRERAS